MPQPSIIINKPGPLPITADVQTGDVGPATLAVSGSVWSETPNTQIGIEVFLDGSSIGSSTIYSNQIEEHRATVTAHIPITLDKPFTGEPPETPPIYAFELRALNAQTNSDQNDVFQATLIG